ncbi:MAG: hypothetical protein PVI30_12440 [Myxococcales bacterium]
MDTSALAPIAFMLALACCGGCSDDGQGGAQGAAGSGVGEGRRLTVRYDVSGTFDRCTVFYIDRREDVAADEENRGGDSLSDDVSLPWTHTFDVTVTALHPFVAHVGAVCAGEDADQVTARVTIDGVEADVGIEPGPNANAAAEIELTETAP